MPFSSDFLGTSNCTFDPKISNFSISEPNADTPPYCYGFDLVDAYHVVSFRNCTLVDDVAVNASNLPKK